MVEQAEQVEEKVEQKQIDTKIIICDPEKCTGCRICEYICSVTNHKQINPRLARIKVLRIEPVFDVALSCRKCDNPKCLDACARHAISQDPETRTIIIDREKCDGCGFCMEECSFGIISMGLDKRVSYVCDNCKENNDGEPACVDYCPKEALSFTSISEIEDENVKKFHQDLQEKYDIPEGSD